MEKTPRQHTIRTRILLSIIYDMRRVQYSCMILSYSQLDLYFKRVLKINRFNSSWKYGDFVFFFHRVSPLNHNDKQEN